MVVWTVRTAQELLQNQSIVCAQIPLDVTSPLYHLVIRHQIHRCSIRYCKNNDPGAPCRFNYPHLPVSEPYIENDRCYYKRDAQDQNVNPYCPWLLSMFRTNMDIQINLGNTALYYLAKYLSKAEDLVDYHIVPHHYRPSDVTATDHYKSRVVGAIEASFLILGLHILHSSRNVIFVPTNLPHDDQRGLRDDLATLEPTDEDIFARNLMEKYQDRENGDNLTLILFVQYYNEVYDNNRKNTIKRQRPVQRHIQELNINIPNYITSANNRLFTLTTGKKKLWRTRQVSPSVDNETFYYQQIVTKLPIFRTTFDHLKTRIMGETSTWKEFYVYLVNRNQIIQETHIPDSYITPEDPPITLQHLNHYQAQIFSQVTHKIEHLNIKNNWIMGAAGTGKSYLLKAFKYHYTQLGYCVVTLAPTGVAAYNIHGQTIHRFFGMTNDRNELNILKLTHHVRLHPRSLFLIDEFSMISREVLERISSTFIQVTNRNMLFGGIPFIFFGDLGQLLPINRNEGYIWESPIFQSTHKYNLTINIRQQNDAYFRQVLLSVRRGDFFENIVHFIRSRLVPKNELPPDAVRLYTTRAFVNHENNLAINQIPGDLKSFIATDYPSNNEFATRALNAESKLLSRLNIKVGCTVMLTHNIDVENGWANGVLAIVKGTDEHNIHLQHTETLQERYIQRIQEYVYGSVYTRRQFPIVLAAACTIHRVQSLTLPKVAIFFTDMETHGQLYVALSRVKSARDIYFFGINANDVTRRARVLVNADAIEIIRNLDDR